MVRNPRLDDMLDAVDFHDLVHTKRDHLNTKDPYCTKEPMPRQGPFYRRFSFVMVQVSPWSMLSVPLDPSINQSINRDFASFTTRRPSIVKFIRLDPGNAVFIPFIPTCWNP